MLFRLIALAAGIALVLWFLKNYQKANAQDRNQAAIKLVAYSIAGLLVLLVAMGKAPPLMTVVSAALLFYQRIAMAGRLLTRFLPATGFTPSLTTAWLKIHFGLEQKQFDAIVLKGEFTGKRLSQLSDEQLSALEQATADDRQSHLAVKTYRLLTHPNAQPNSADDQASMPAQLSRAQAAEILGVRKQASKAEISKAHKLLVNKLHPDKGGSTYLTTQINLARDTLLTDHHAV